MNVEARLLFNSILLLLTVLVLGYFAYRTRGEIEHLHARIDLLMPAPADANVTATHTAEGEPLQ
jgi:hypothetical protein